MVSVTGETTISQNIDVAKTAMSVYNLPNTKEVVRFLHYSKQSLTQRTYLIRAIPREEKARSRRKRASIAGWRCGTSPSHETNSKPMLPSALRDGKARRAPEGARRSSPQSSGDRVRLISLN